MSLEDESNFDHDFLTKVGGLLQTLVEDDDVEHIRFEHFPFNNETFEEVYRGVKDLVENEKPTNVNWTRDKAMYLSSELVYWNYMRKVKKMTEDELLATKDDSEKTVIRWALVNGYYDFNEKTTPERTREIEMGRFDAFDTLVNMFRLKDKSWVRKLTLDNITDHNLVHEIGNCHALTHLYIMYDYTNEKHTNVHGHLFPLHKLMNQIHGLNNLTTLNIACVSFFRDFSPLGQLTQLTNLGIYSCPNRDISSFSSLINLTHLNLQENGFDDVTPLSQLTNLTYLNVGGNYIRDISPLAGLTNLVYLDVCYNRIRDISPLSNLVNLVDLSLSNNRFSDISPITNLVKLETLDVDSNDIVDISALSNLTNITCLYLDTHKIADTSVLSKFTKLTKLNGRPTE